MAAEGCEGQQALKERSGRPGAGVRREMAMYVDEKARQVDRSVYRVAGAGGE